MKSPQLILLALLALLFAGCSASVPIRPSSFFLLDNEAVPPVAEPAEQEKEAQCEMVYPG